jgi:hypothetical protein
MLLRLLGEMEMDVELDAAAAMLVLSACEA